MKEKTKQENPGRVGAGKFWAWQSRGISLACEIMILAYITIYCTNTMGMTPGLVGGILMASKIFDGFTDLLAGYLIDRTNTKIGRGRPYELAIIGVWITTWLLFTMPESGNMTIKCIWLFCMYTLNQSIFITFLNANSTVYMIRAFDNEQQYLKINAFGGIAVTLGAVVVNTILPLTVSRMATSAQGWSKMILYYSIPLLIIGLMRFLFVKEKNSAEFQSQTKVSMKEVFEVLKTNKFIYFVGLLLFVYNMITNMGVATYYFTYVVGNLELASFLGIISVLVLFSMTLYTKLLKKWTVKQLIQRGCFLYAVGMIVYFFAGANVPMIIIAGLISGSGTLPIAYMNYQMILDCAAYNEWKGHARMEGTMTSIVGFASKVGAAFGVGLLGILLEVSGFVSGSDGLTIEQPDSAVWMIRLLMTLIPMAFYLLLALVLRFYKLDDLMPQIRQDLEKKSSDNLEPVTE